MEGKLRRRVLIAVGTVVGVATVYLVVVSIIDADPDSVSAFVIVVLTAALVAVTTLYVLITHDLVGETARANDLAVQNAERVLRAEAPILEVREGGRGLDEEAGVWTFGYAVRNSGRSVAHRARLHTKYGAAATDEPVDIDMPTNVFHNSQLRIGVADHPENDHPEVIYFSFVDPGGTWWRQVPGGLPTLVGGPPD